MTSETSVRYRVPPMTASRGRSGPLPSPTRAGRGGVRPATFDTAEGVQAPKKGRLRKDEPPRPRVQPLPAAPCRKPRGLVSLGRRGLPEGASGGQADLPLDRLLDVLLVPRHGARELLGTRD